MNSPAFASQDVAGDQRVERRARVVAFYGAQLIYNLTPYLHGRDAFGAEGYLLMPAVRRDATNETLRQYNPTCYRPTHTQVSNVSRVATGHPLTEVQLLQTGKLHWSTVTS